MANDPTPLYDSMVDDERDEAASQRALRLAQAHLPLQDRTNTMDAGDSQSRQLVPRSASADAGALVAFDPPAENRLAIRDTPATDQIVLATGGLDISPGVQPDAAQLKPLTLSKYRELRMVALGESNKENTRSYQQSYVRTHADCFSDFCDKSVARDRGIIPRVLTRRKPCNRFMCPHRTMPSVWNVASQLKAIMLRTVQAHAAKAEKLQLALAIRVQRKCGSSWMMGQRCSFT